MRGPALLFCPADRPDRFEKAQDRADVVVLDLEDAVATDRKEFARTALLRCGLKPDRVIIRVNTNDPVEAEKDREAIARTHYRKLVIPKVRDAYDLTPWQGWELIPQLETPASMVHANEIAQLPGVVALTWGAEDLTAALGGTSSLEDNGEYSFTLSFARSLVLFAAANAEIDALDAPLKNYKNFELQHRHARSARLAGYAGAFCIHPDQVAAVRSGFCATGDETEIARGVLQSSTDGVNSYNDTMVDAPLIAQAHHLLAQTQPAP